MRLPEPIRLDLLTDESRLRAETGKRDLTRADILIALAELLHTDPDVYAKTARRLNGAPS